MKNKNNNDKDNEDNEEKLLKEDNNIELNNGNNKIEKITQNKNQEKKLYISDYYCGYLTISFNEFIFSIKINSILDYICSLIFSKFLIVLFINFFSRAQKLKFIEEYKNEFNGSIKWHILNYVLSNIIVYVFLGLFALCYKDEKKNILRQKETSIMITIGINSVFMLFISLFNRFFSSSIITFLAITISGQINYLLYEYYSTQQIEYTLLSGFISLGQIFFRLLEFEVIISFEEDFWYYVQMGISIFDGLFCLLYIIICWNKCNSENNENNENQNNNKN